MYWTPSAVADVNKMLSYPTNTPTSTDGRTAGRNTTAYSDAIIVKVIFGFTTAGDGSTVENNFVVTAWPAYMESLER
jgi:hypothetical protein